MSKSKSKKASAAPPKKAEKAPESKPETTSQQAPEEAVVPAEPVAADTPKQEAPAKPYFAGIDIVKILAVFLVVSVHFFLYSGFYSTPITDEKWMPAIAHRWFSYCCVPLFMITTGYLMKNKKFSLKYFTGLTKILVFYVIISIICIRFRTIQFHEEFDKWKLLKCFLEFNGANYGWYVNYYIGLFLVIPFVNMAFNGAKGKGTKLFLCIVVPLTTVFARSFFLGFETGNQIRLFPDYMNGAWPLSYYLAGAFIREYPSKNTKERVIIKLAALIVGGATLYYLTWSTFNHSMGNAENDFRFYSRHYNDYSSWPVFIITICIFLLLHDIKSSNKHVKFVLRQLADTTFVLYLISYIFDQKNYADWNRDYIMLHQKIFRFLHGGSTDALSLVYKYEDVYDRWIHCHEAILRTFFASLFWALILNNLYHLCEKLIKKGIELYKSEKAANAESTQKPAA